MRPPEKIGIIAGQGDLPELLSQRIAEQGNVPVLVALKDITPPEILAGRTGAIIDIGQAGKILRFFHEHGVRKLLMAGGLARPNFWTLKVDWTGMKIISSLLFRQVGDDTLLKAIRRAIENDGIEVIGAHQILPEIICQAGVMGRVPPDQDQLQIIRKGFHLAKAHGAEDKGQSIIINDQGAQGYEDRHGTNALIRKCTGTKNSILVKVSKPQQDLALDMPTIGPSTIRRVREAGLVGIAIEAGKTIVLEKESVIRLCDELGIFLIGIEEEK